MATMYYDNDADQTLLDGKKVAVIGFGSQGHAHALNLKDSGIEVRVGLRPDSKSQAKAESAGFTVGTVADVAEWADIVMILAPDTKQPAIYRDASAPHLKAGDTLMFSHGFNIRYGTIEAPAGVDVSMVAPKSPGHRVRETYQEGAGTPCLVAVHQDASGNAKALALAYAKAIGGTRAGVIETSFAEECETDLFGEQAVLCGGVSELVKAGFEALPEAGYQPEVAYFECLHELKLIVDLMYRGGLNYMRYSVSDTAEYGDYVSGPRVVGAEAKAGMKAVLEDIQDGTFARNWIDENASGRENFEKTRRAEQDLSLEEVGVKLRKMMPFLDAVTVKAGD